MVKEEVFHKAILDNLTGGLIGVDMEGRVVYMNSMAGKILRADENACLYKDFRNSFASYPELIEAIDRIMKTGKTARRAELKILHADVPLKIGYGTMVVKAGDKILGYSIIFQNISFGN
ncbi:MAG: hypothetical protein Fur0012_03300 [Elusimicrobiota bacterium]